MAERLTLKPHQAVVFTELNDGEGVLLHLESQFYYSLNPMGSYLWRLIESKEARDKPSLVNHLARVYSISKERASSDVDEFLNNLKAESLLEIA